MQNGILTKSKISQTWEDYISNFKHSSVKCAHSQDMVNTQYRPGGEAVEGAAVGAPVVGPAVGAPVVGAPVVGVSGSSGHMSQ